MTNLERVLSEIRGLSPGELQELKARLQMELPANGTPAGRELTRDMRDDFDADLDAIAFAAHPLASTFSRADIYDELD